MDFASRIHHSPFTMVGFHGPNSSLCCSPVPSLTLTDIQEPNTPWFPLFWSLKAAEIQIKTLREILLYMFPTSTLFFNTSQLLLRRFVVIWFQRGSSSHLQVPAPAIELNQKVLSGRRKWLAGKHVRPLHLLLHLYIFQPYFHPIPDLHLPL